MNPYERMARQQRQMRGLGRLGDTGSATGLPPVGAQPFPGNIPANAGGSIVQGDGFYYIYNIAFNTAIASGVNSTVTQQFDQVTVFKWVRTTYYVDLAGAVQTDSSRVIPLVTLKITDAGSGMSFMNSAVPINDLAGTAEVPYVLPTPQFILANAVLQFTALNISAATTYNNLMLQLHGYKLYNYQQGQQS